MLRTLSEAHPHRPLFSIIAGLVSLAAVMACGAKVDTSGGTASAQEQALTEAQTSYSDAKAAADACFTTFEACKTPAGADVAACEKALQVCLPATAGPGPHCGGGHGHRHGGPGGDHDGDGPKGGENGQPPPPTDPGPGAPPKPPPPGSGDAPPPPLEGGKPGGPPAGGPGAPECGGHPDGNDGGHPDFCKNVPLPQPPELKACHDAIHACIASGGDRKACFDVDRACMKAAFDAAFQKLCAANDGSDERLTKLCAGGVAPPPPAPGK